MKKPNLPIPVKPTSIPTPSPTPTPRPPLKVKGSIPYWDQQKASESFKDNVNVFDQISLFWYYLGTNGNVLRYEYAKEDQTLIEFARKNKVQVLAVITNLPEEEGSTWDSERVARNIKDPEHRAQQINEILKLINKKQFDGVVIDYEEVEANQRDNFTLFIDELARTLHKENKLVGVSLHPKTGEESEARYHFQDWRLLSNPADFLYIMSYGEHWDEGSPGPIASVDWFTKIISYAKGLNLPLFKFYLGIPLYGYDWKDDSDEAAIGLTYTDVQKLIQKYAVNQGWDADSQSPFFHYTSRGKQHEVWYEDAASVREKVKLADEQGFAGVSFWRLGGEDPGVWNAFSSSLP